MIWTPAPKQVEARLAGIFSDWQNTPFMQGQRQKGGGVDCVNLATAILDELFDTYTEAPPFHVRTSTHDRAAAMRVAHTLMRAWPHVIVRDGTVRPADVLVMRAELGGVGSSPGHVAVCGPRPYTALHATSGGVRLIGLGGLRLLRVYRPTLENLCSF